MKKLKKLEGAKQISKNQQRLIYGGVKIICEGCHPNDDCCINGMCGRYGANGQCYPV